MNEFPPLTESDTSDLLSPFLPSFFIYFCDDFMITLFLTIIITIIIIIIIIMMMMMIIIIIINRE